MFVIDTQDVNGTGNGDICIKTDKGTLVALVFAGKNASAFAECIAQCLNSTFCPWHTDLMVPPETV